MKKTTGADAIDISTAKPKAKAKPKPKPAAAKPSTDDPKRQRVLELIALGMSVRAATEAVGMSRGSFYTWCKTDSAYREMAERIRGVHIAEIDDILHEVDADARAVIHRIIVDENVTPGIRLRAATTVLNRKGPGWLPRELPPHEYGPQRNLSPFFIRPLGASPDQSSASEASANKNRARCFSAGAHQPLRIHHIERTPGNRNTNRARPFRGGAHQPWRPSPNRPSLPPSSHNQRRQTPQRERSNRPHAQPKRSKRPIGEPSAANQPRQWPKEGSHGTKRAKRVQAPGKNDERSETTAAARHAKRARIDGRRTPPIHRAKNRKCAKCAIANQHPTIPATHGQSITSRSQAPSQRTPEPKKLCKVCNQQAQAKQAPHHRKPLPASRAAAPSQTPGSEASLQPQSTRHGAARALCLDTAFLARYTVLRHEKAEDFAHLLNEMTAIYEPQSKPEELQVLRISQAHWNLRRIETMEAAVLDSAVDEVRTDYPAAHPIAAIATRFLGEDPSTQAWFCDRMRAFRKVHDDYLERQENRLFKLKEGGEVSALREAKHKGIRQKSKSGTLRQPTRPLALESKLETAFRATMVPETMPIHRALG